MYNDKKYIEVFNVIEELAKNDIGLSEALKLSKDYNHEVPESTPEHLNKDSMIPRAGSLFAYNNHLKNHGASGIHISLDLNSMNSINDAYDWETGNEALKVFYDLLADTADRYKIKVFRTSGAGAHLYTQDTETADAFCNDLVKTLESAPKFKDHKFSVAFGEGYTPEQANDALLKAKDQLGPIISVNGLWGTRKKMNPPGNEKNVGFSLLGQPAPDNWRPETRKAESQEVAIPDGLKLFNPLKPSKV